MGLRHGFSLKNGSSVFGGSSGLVPLTKGLKNSNIWFLSIRLNFGSRSMNLMMDRYCLVDICLLVRRLFLIVFRTGFIRSPFLDK